MWRLQALANGASTEDGFYHEPEIPSPDGPTKAPKTLVQIPPSVIQNAVGLAIFTTMRTGLWVSGAGGSGVLIARMPNGEWSPPSGILLHTAGLGFLVGVDIYDCVVVINNRRALDAFTKVRATLGGEISAVAGPVGVGGVVEHDGRYRQLNRPVFTYMKSRGFYAGVQIDGTIIIERTDENARFYGEKVGVADILAGRVRHAPFECRMLLETVKAAEGRTDVDERLMEELEGQPAPADVGLEPPTRKPPSDINGPVFGIPEPDDPDPFGLLALQAAGLEIKEAGTGSRPPSSLFEFRPSPTSPIYAHFRKKSIDTMGSGGVGSNRTSYQSHMRRASNDRDRAPSRTSQYAEMATQTEPATDDAVALAGLGASPSPRPGASPREPTFPRDNVILEEDHDGGHEVYGLARESWHGNGSVRVLRDGNPEVKEPEEIDYTKIDLGPYTPMYLSDEQSRSTGTTASNSATTNSERDAWSDVHIGPVPHLRQQYASTATAEADTNGEDTHQQQHHHPRSPLHPDFEPRPRPSPSIIADGHGPADGEADDEDESHYTHSHYSDYDPDNDEVVTDPEVDAGDDEDDDEEEEEEEDADADDGDEEDEPVVFEVAAVRQATVGGGLREVLVHGPKRAPPPALPPRSARRVRNSEATAVADGYGADAASLSLSLSLSPSPRSDAGGFGDGDVDVDGADGGGETGRGRGRVASVQDGLFSLSLSPPAMPPAMLATEQVGVQGGEKEIQRPTSLPVPSALRRAASGTSGESGAVSTLSGVSHFVNEPAPTETAAPRVVDPDTEQLPMDSPWSLAELHLDSFQGADGRWGGAAALDATAAAAAAAAAAGAAGAGAGAEAVPKPKPALERSLTAVTTATDGGEESDSFHSIPGTPVGVEGH
jgi:lipid-binding SYLF domain-containing protein